MKKQIAFLGAAAAALAIAMPGVASADSGQIGAHYGNLSPDSGDDVSLYGLDLGYTHDFSNGWSVQADATSDRIDASSINFGTDYAALNLGTRTDSYSAYGYVAHTGFGLGDAWGVGVGGQLYLSNVTLDGSLGYASFDEFGSTVNATDIHVDGTWYFSDDIGVSADVGYIDVDSETATLYGIGAVWRFSGSPIAINGGWEHTSADFGDVDAWRVGLTWNFGTATAREQSQKGPSWNGARQFYQDFISAL